MAEPRWLDEAQARAWQAYRRLRDLLDLQISRDLAADSGLSDADYAVLSDLSETAGHRMRLTELATHMLWSKSRLSHQLTRMQQRGLVARQECPTDARGAVIVLTDAGWEAIKAAAPRHLESVRRHFIDLLTSEQLAVLGDISETVVRHLSDLGNPTAVPSRGRGGQPRQTPHPRQVREPLPAPHPVRDA